MARGYGSESIKFKVLTALRSVGKEGITNVELSKVNIRYGGYLGILYQQGYEGLLVKMAYQPVYLVQGLYLHQICCCQPAQKVVQKHIHGQLHRLYHHHDRHGILARI